MKRTLLFGTLVVLLLGGAFALRRQATPPPDPTLAPVARTLTLGDVSASPGPDGLWRLRGTVATNLPAATSLRLTISHRDVVTQETLSVGDRSFAVARPGLVTSGRYEVAVELRIEDQPRAVAEELRYQPRRLRAARVVELAGAAPEPARARLTELVRRLNATPDRPTLASVGQDAAALDAGLWVSTLSPSVRALRRLVEEAGATPDQEALRRKLVTVSVLSELE